MDSFNAPVEPDHADDTVSSHSLGSLLSGEGKSNPRTALENAIEAGDWNAAGQAAARMGDASESSVATSDLGSLGESSLSSRPSKSNRQPEHVRSRVIELDRLIEKGDWSAVVAAATRFNAADAKQGQIHIQTNRTAGKGDWASLGTGSGGSIEGANWKKRLFNRNKLSVGSSLDNESRGMSITDGSTDKNKSALQDEQEALAQAELWMKIAAQSKSDGTLGQLRDITDDDTNCVFYSNKCKLFCCSASRGAIDAADWAISRSLSALKVKEQSSTVKGIKSTLLNSGQSVGSSTLDQSL